MPSKMRTRSKSILVGQAYKNKKEQVFLAVTKKLLITYKDGKQIKYSPRKGEVKLKILVNKEVRDLLKDWRISEERFQEEILDPYVYEVVKPVSSQEASGKISERLKVSR